MRLHINITLLLAIAVASTMFFISRGSSEVYKYESHGKRDPFVPLVGVDRPAVSRLQDVTSIGDIRLEGIASRSNGKLVAILNGEIVKEGDSFGVIKVRKITNKTVTIDVDGKTFEKALTEGDMK